MRRAPDGMTALEDRCRLLHQGRPGLAKPEAFHEYPKNAELLAAQFRLRNPWLDFALRLRGKVFSSTLWVLSAQGTTENRPLSVEATKSIGPDNNGFSMFFPLFQGGMHSP